MTRKPLPKAIRRPEGEAPEVASERKRGGRRQADDKAAESADAAATAASAAEPIGATETTMQTAPAADVETARPAEPLPATMPQEAEPVADPRREQARRIVERHKMYAAMGGLLPLPIISVAGVTAINLKMVKALSDLYGVPFERDRNRSIIVGLMGGAVPTGFAAATVSTLVFVIPGSAFVGLAVSSVTAAACTRGIGMVFIDHFESTSGRAGER